jgi:hypothetical protein
LAPSVPPGQSTARRNTSLYISRAIFYFSRALGEDFLLNFRMAEMEKIIKKLGHFETVDLIG